LADVGETAGYTKSLPKKSPYLQIVEIARSGNPEKALAEASKFSQNLYMDHGLVASLMVFDDAVKREDLKTMIYFANYSFKNISDYNANAWQKIAELQIKKGDRHNAKRSYERALMEINNSPSPYRFLSEVKAQLAIGESMITNGLTQEGQNIIIDSERIANFIPKIRIDEHIKANILLAKAFWNLKKYESAKEKIILAYNSAHTYKGNYKLRKSNLLSEIATTIATFTTSK
jgi:tetratricopeptide (TPR) repeat protein